MTDYSICLSTRKRTVTLASNVPISNMLCNMAWDKGLIVSNLIGSGSLKEFLRFIEEEEPTEVYVQSLKLLGSTNGQIADSLRKIRPHGTVVIFPDWELNPSDTHYDTVLRVFDDMWKYEVSGRLDVQRMGREYGKHIPPKIVKRKLPMKEICSLRAKGYGWATISKDTGIPRTTLIGRKKDIEDYMNKNGYCEG